MVGPHCLRFENDLPGRPARASRAFGVDGRKYDALIVHLWVRVADVLEGERIGEEPGVTLTAFDPNLRPISGWNLGPWTETTVGTGWVRVGGRMPILPEVRDVILTIGLYGATGVLEIDGMTFQLAPRGGEPTTELVLNGDFELGDPIPDQWELIGNAHRVFPGHESDSALELDRAGSQAQAGVTVPVNQIDALEFRLYAKAAGLRGSGGAAAEVYYFGSNGEPLRGVQAGARLFRWTGSFDWRPFRTVVSVPPDAFWAVVQFEKTSAGGTIAIDDVSIASAPGVSWVPYHVTDEIDDWDSYEPAPTIQADSALDFSFLLEPPAGGQGRVVVRDNQLEFENGGCARFLGVALLPPLAFGDSDKADRLADRLARSGVNLVRLGALDAPIGPALGLFDDARDDTKALDPVALGRLDHLIAALKARGIYVAMELQARRKFRKGDGLAEHRRLPPGGGAAAAFDPEIRTRALEAAELFLGHTNPETGLALRDDPVLAWVTLAGELSLFNLIDDPASLPPESAGKFRDRLRESGHGSGRRAWEAIESAQWEAEAKALRENGLKAPIAGSSHWRREPEFVAAQAGPALDLIEDRLYWAPPRWGDADHRSMLWGPAEGVSALAAQKRRRDRPYVVGEFASQTAGAAVLPYEAADFLHAVARASASGWSALVRRGVATYPESWGRAASGTGGENDLTVVPEAINGYPPVFALLPHAASLFLRGGDKPPRLHETPGSLSVESRFTRVFAGWNAGRSFDSGPLRIESFSEFSVVATSSVGEHPIEDADRLLVTLVGRAEPTGFAWVDHWRREVASPGQAPLRMEPVRARLTWARTDQTPVHAYVLDNSGARRREVPVEVVPNGVRVDLDGGADVHWELVAGAD